jgi:metal-responsive CopG/Arc/MetJ family transcriptional regulator
MSIANRDIIFYTCKEKNEREERFEDFFGILVSLYNHKEIYVTCCNMEGAESKSVAYVACHVGGQTQSKDVWTGVVH